MLEATQIRNHENVEISSSLKQYIIIVHYTNKTKPLQLNHKIDFTTTSTSTNKVQYVQGVPYP